MTFSPTPEAIRVKIMQKKKTLVLGKKLPA
jgi:hypothetical protein